MAKAQENSKVYTFEGCPETAKIAQKNFDASNTKNIDLILGDFQHTLVKKLNETGAIDLFFIDGNHREKLQFSILMSV